MGKCCEVCNGFGSLWIMVSDMTDKEYGFYRISKCTNCNGNGKYREEEQ